MSVTGCKQYRVCAVVNGSEETRRRAGYGDLSAAVRDIKIPRERLKRTAFDSLSRYFGHTPI